MKYPKSLRMFQNKVTLRLHTFVQHSERKKRGAIVVRDALVAVRGVTSKGVFVGRGPHCERRAGRFNRACISLGSVIYDIESEWWAIGTLTVDELATWQRESFL